MKNKILMLVAVLLLMLSFSACSKGKNSISIKDNSKVLATVNGEKITQYNVDVSRINSTFSEKEMLEKLINDKLLLIKAKELKISVSEKEARAEAQKQRDLLKKMGDKDESKSVIDKFIKDQGITENQYWDTYAVQSYKTALTIGKVKKKLGMDLDKTLEKLRGEVEIKYYN